MPIPPRPIPASNRVRPGVSVPRKSLASLDKVDWRAEMSLLNDHPRSLPTGSSGIRLEKSLPKSIERSDGLKREVDLEGLITDSLGKREKRTSTATNLGFDFIANPAIVALPDTAHPKANQSHTKPTSMLTESKNQPFPVAAIPKGRISPPLSQTPTTPALIPHQTHGDDDLDDWEHIDALVEERESADSQSEEDVIVMGELELDDEFDQVQLRRDQRHAAKTAMEWAKTRDGITYAAALGAKKS